MNHRIKLVLVLAAVVVVGVLAWPHRPVAQASIDKHKLAETPALQQRVDAVSEPEPGTRAAILPTGNQDRAAEAERADSNPSRLRGRVVDDLNQPFPSVDVVACDEHDVPRARVQSDEDGQFAFDLDPGIYVFGLDPKTLPEGFAAPAQATSTVPELSSPRQRQKVELVAGVEHDPITLIARHESRVFGRVLDPNGLPIGGAGFTLYSCGESWAPWEFQPSGETDANGFFEVKEPLLGFFRLHVYSYPALEEARDEAIGIAPSAVEFEIPASGSYDLGTLQFGADGVTVQGRIVDQDGHPFVGQTVSASYNYEPHGGWVMPPYAPYIARAKTDVEGVYRFDDLPNAQIKFQLVQYEDYDELGKDKVAYHVKSIQCDLTPYGNDSVVDLGTHQVLESRPYRLDIHIDIDEKWAQKVGIRVNRLDRDLRCSVTLKVPQPSAYGMTHEEAREAFGGYPSFDSGSRLDFDKETRTFHWITQTPREECILEIKGPREAHMDPIEVEVLPRPNQTDEIRISIP